MVKSIKIFMGVVCCYVIAFGQWSKDISENTVVSYFTQNPIVVSDMENGAIIISQTEMYAPLMLGNRINLEGEKVWEDDILNMGVVITRKSGEQWLVDRWSPEKQFVMSDGKGGCYIVYQIGIYAGTTGGVEPWPIYDEHLHLQHLDADGNRLFGDDGFELMPETVDSSEIQHKMRFWCADGEGGLYVIWYRWNKWDGGNGIYLARISPQGSYIWGPKRIEPDGSHSYILNVDQNLNLKLLRDGDRDKAFRDTLYTIDKLTGNTLDKKVVELGVGEHGFSQAFMKSEPSDNNSTIAVYRDFRTDTLRALKMDDSGNNLWGEGPIFITTNMFGYVGFEIESDKLGGMYILYQTEDKDSLKLVHINNIGEINWEYNRLKSNESIATYNTNLSAGEDGSIFLLSERVKYLTKIDKDGEFQWKTQVTSRDSVVNRFTYYTLLADDIGGCIVVWYESGDFYGLRAQRINKNGKLGTLTSIPIQRQNNDRELVKFNGTYPNPSNSTVKVSFELLKPQYVELKVYNILGMEVKTLIAENLSSGQHVKSWHGLDNNNLPVSSGIYFAILESGEYKKVQKILITK